MRRDDGGHELKNFVAGGGGTIDRIVEERKRQAREFEIQLESSDACGGAAQFKVHITEMVFAADDIGEHLVADHFGACGIKFRDEPDADSGDGGFEGDACIEEGKGTSADAGHGGGTVGFHDL